MKSFGIRLVNSHSFGQKMGKGLGGGIIHILAIRVCTAGKGMVFKPSILGQGLVIIENWSRIGSRLTDDSFTHLC